MKFNRLCVVAIIALAVLASQVSYAAEYDLGGREVNIWVWYDVLSPFREGGLYEGRIAQIEEEFNCKIVKKDFPPDAIDQFVARLLAGDSTLDIWMVRGSAIPNLALKGALLPLDEVLPDDAFAAFPEAFQGLIDMYRYRGQIFGYLYTHDYPNNVRWVGFNRDLLEREGQPNPYELVKNDEWTWDKYMEICKAVTKDTDGDGKIDQWAEAHNPRAHWWYSNGAAVTRYIDGRMTFTFNEPEAIRALEYAAEIQRSGVVANSNTPFGSGKGAFAQSVLWHLKSMMDKAGARWGIVPLPKGPDAENYVVPGSEDLALFCLPVNSEYPEALAEILMILWPAEEQMEKTVEYIRTIAQDREMAEMLMTAMDLYSFGNVNVTKLSLGALNTGSSELGAAVQRIVAGEAGKPIMDELAPKMQLKLDELFNW